jgi:hypothetical protein
MGPGVRRDDGYAGNLAAVSSSGKSSPFAALVEPAGYQLTGMGRELNETFLPLHRFAERLSKLTTN